MSLSKIDEWSRKIASVWNVINEKSAQLSNTLILFLFLNSNCESILKVRNEINYENHEAFQRRIEKAIDCLRISYRSFSNLFKSIIYH